MNLELIRQRLLELGYAESDVEAWLEITPESGQTFLQALAAAGVPMDAQRVFAEEWSGHESGLAIDSGQRMEQYARIAAAIEADEPVTRQEREFFESFQETLNSDTALAREFFRRYGEQEDWNIDWVYNVLGVTPMALDSDKALLQLLPILEEVVGVDIDDELTDAEKASQVKQILARNREHPAVQVAVQEWARKTQNSIPDMTVLALAQQFPWERAMTITSTAKQWDLDPMELANVWQNQKEGVYFGGSVMGLERAKARGEDVTKLFTRRPLLETAAGYKAGLELYDGSKVLAAVHLNDPSLASRLQRDPYGLDSGELRRVLDYIGGPEGKEGDPQVKWLVDRLSGVYSGTTTVTHDPEQVRNAVQTLADAWNLTGSEGVAAAIAGEIVANAVARARASLPNPFASEVSAPIATQETIEDIVAHVKARFRQLPEYGELFGEKRAGESEEEYVSRFERQSQHILGDDNTAVVRAGMRSGNINTIYQQALLTDAGESSTRFQEIMARNARVFREFL